MDGEWNVIVINTICTFFFLHASWGSVTGFNMLIVEGKKKKKTSSLHFQFISCQPHFVRSLREEQDVPRDRGGQPAAAGGPRGLETPGPEGHQVHLRPHLGRLLHPSRGKNKTPLFLFSSSFQISQEISCSLKCLQHAGFEGFPWRSCPAGQRLRHVSGWDVADRPGGQSL